MPTPTTQITTKDTVKSFIGITSSGDDTLLGLMCDWLTAFIQAYCGQPFLEQTFTDEIYSSKDFRFDFWLDRSPLKSVTKFEKKQSDGSFLAMTENEDYQIDLSTGFIRMNQIDNGIADLKITYVTKENIPADLAMVATQLVARAYNKRKSEGVSQENLGEASVQWSALINDSDKAILNLHRRFSAVV